MTVKNSTRLNHLKHFTHFYYATIAEYKDVFKRQVKNYVSKVSKCATKFTL